MKAAQYLAVVVAMASVARSDITGSNPGRNTCLCFNGNNVNIRSTACGTVIGSANSGQCFRYNGAKSTCSLSGRSYDFFQISWNGRDGWAAGTYLDQAPDSRCGGGSTVAGEYTCDVTDSGKRIHETMSATPFDCKDSSCRNTCRGGQCVAYVTCKCRRNGRNVPNTSCWRPGRKVKNSDGRCNRNIAPNTAIATFGSTGRYSEHAAVFIRCIDDYTVQVYDQYCGRSVGYSQYPSSHRFYSAFATITNTACADRSSWPCRVETSGPTNCPASQSHC